MRGTRSEPRLLRADDSELTRALVNSVLGTTPYFDRIIELLQAAERNDPERQGLVIVLENSAAALALYESVAGTDRTWRLNAALVDPALEFEAHGRSLLNAVANHVRRAGGRLLVAELPDDPALGYSLSILRAYGFSEEGRVPDFFRDGVALTFQRLDLQPVGRTSASQR